MPNLKIADRGDIEGILYLMACFKDESAYKDLPTDIPRILETIDEYLNDLSSIIILALEGNRVVGIIVGKSSVMPFNSLVQTCENIWYVLPEYRTTGIGLKLYEQFIVWSKGLGSKVIHTASPNGSGLDTIYEKMGYKMLEKVYIWLPQEQ